MTITLFGGLTLPKKIKRLFKKPGIEAHLYLFGANGQPVQGFQPGNYFDSAGTTHASVDGSVGLVLDAAGSVGAELVTNGDFSGGTAGWNLGAGYSISSGKLIATASSSNGDYAFAYSSGKTYRVTYTIDSITGNVSVNLGGALGTVRNAAGTYSELITTVDALSFVRVQSRFGTASFVVDNVSVKEVTGIHATQSTPGYKPTLRKGIVNLLTWGNDLTNAVWLRAGSPVVTPTSFARTVTSASYIANTTTPAKPATALPYTAATVASAGSGRYVSIRMQGSYPSRVDAVFDLQNGVVAGGYPTVSGTFTSPSASIVSLGNGKYLCAASAVSDTSLGITPFISFNSAGVQVDGTDSIETSSGSIYGLGLFAGTLTAAQIIAAGGIPITTTAPASSQAGVNYLEFVDTNLQCLKRPPASVGASGWAVVAIAASKVANMSPMGSLGTVNDIGYAGYAFKLRANGDVWLRVGDGSGVQGNISEVLAGANTYQVGKPIILSMRWVAGGQLVGRVNGVDIGSVLCVNPSGANNGVVIGAHNAIPNEYFSGKIFFNQDGVGAISAQDIATIEKQAAAAAGIQL